MTKNNGWKQVSQTFTMSEHRTGFLYYWDKLVALVFNKPQRTNTNSYTVSFWVKNADETRIELTKGTVEISTMSNETLRMRCDDMLTYIFGSEEDVEPWWNSPNSGFDGETPKKVFDTDPNRVYNYLIDMKEGEW